MGVRAIERQTAPLDETLQAVNGDLEAVAGALAGAEETPAHPRRRGLSAGAAWLVHRSAGGPHTARRRWDDPCVA